MPCVCTRSGHVEQSAWVSIDHLKVVAMGGVYIAYDKERDKISGAFRTFKDAQNADPILAHQPRYPRLHARREDRARN